MSVGAFFLTDMDPRLRLAGSRDALGGQGLWATVGRRLVGNLTLASNDAAGFRTLLIGYGLAGDEQDNAERLRLFLRWEQVAAGARVAAGDRRAPLGAQKVRRSLVERHLMTIGEGREHQILGDQRASGLWVLYHRAARDSGLVDDRRRLTATGQRLFDGWAGALPPTVVRRVRQRGPQPVRFGKVGEPSEESSQIEMLLVRGTRADRLALLNVLVRGVEPAGATGRGPAEGCQQRLADLLAQQDVVGSWRDRLPDLLRRAEGDSELADRLGEVLVTESVLLPAQVAFDALLLDGNGVSTRAFAARVSRAWPDVPGTVRVSEFRAGVAPRLRGPLGGRRTNLWVEVAEAMAEGRWERALDRLVEINGATMERRGGAPWVRTASGGKLDVRLPLGAALPAQADVTGGWRNPYYLDPLLSVQRDLLGRRRL